MSGGLSPWYRIVTFWRNCSSSTTSPVRLTLTFMPAAAREDSHIGMILASTSWRGFWCSSKVSSTGAAAADAEAAGALGASADGALEVDGLAVPGEQAWMRSARPKAAVTALDLRTRLLLERSAAGPITPAISPDPTGATGPPRFAPRSRCAHTGNPAANLRHGRRQSQCAYASRPRCSRSGPIDDDRALP